MPKPLRHLLYRPIGCWLLGPSRWKGGSAAYESGRAANYKVSESVNVGEIGGAEDGEVA